MAWKQIADSLGIPFDETVNDRLRGVSRMESLEIILERADRIFTRLEKDTLAYEKNKLYRKSLLQMSEKDLELSVKITLNRLRESGLLLAIGSSSKNAGIILNQIGLGDFFDAVSDGNNISRSKPDPEVFLCAAKMLELMPEECLVVEDAVAGIQAAVSGGFRSVALGDAVSKTDADYHILKFPELLEVCKLESIYFG